MKRSDMHILMVLKGVEKGQKDADDGYKLELEKFKLNIDMVYDRMKGKKENLKATNEVDKK